ncbi:MAG: hypothetical protein WC678_03920 [Parcubacteria group bacterium]|jgi:hypothetical protein
MNKKILVIIIGLFILTALIVGAIFLSHKDQKIISGPIDLNKLGVCNIDSDCIRILGYEDGCPTCNSYAGNIYDEKNYTFGKPSNNFSKCPMLDCYDPPIAHPACVNNRCVLAKNSKISDCNNNITCLLGYAQENNDRSICDKIKTLSPNFYSTCLFQFAQNVEDCNVLSNTLGIPTDSEQTTRCFTLHAKTNVECNFIQSAYEKNKCLAETATKIKECEFIDPSITEKKPTNYRLLCFRRTENAIPESIDDCNLVILENDFPINCINNFVEKDLSEDVLINSCYKLKNKKSIDYCLSQVN